MHHSTHVPIEEHLTDARVRFDRAGGDSDSEEPQREQQAQGGRKQQQQNNQQVAKPSQNANANPQSSNPQDLALQNQALMQQLEILKAQTATPAPGGQRIAPVRQSRIVDRPPKENGDSSLKINIELDLEVEVDLYARVKGDVTIGLM